MSLNQVKGGNRHANRHRRYDNKLRSVHNMTSILSNLFDSKIKYPTTLMELSERNYKRFTDNAIHVKGISVVPKGVESSSEVLYSSVVYGTNVNVTNTKVDIDNVGRCHKVNLSKCKDRYIMIIADLEECQEILPHILSFSTCFTEEKTTMQKTGKVIIMVCS